jgi:hypothetical protein
MAEKNVSGPPVLTTRPTKPVSEALLNEKVRGAAWSTCYIPRVCKSALCCFRASDYVLHLFHVIFLASHASVASAGMWQLAREGRRKRGKEDKAECLRTLPAVREASWTAGRHGVFLPAL